MTRAGAALVAKYRAGAERCRKLAEAETEIIRIAVWNSWADCYEHCAREAEASLHQIEVEARLVPEVEEMYASLREKLLDEEFAA